MNFSSFSLLVFHLLILDVRPSQVLHTRVYFKGYRFSKKSIYVMLIGTCLIMIRTMNGASQQKHHSSNAAYFIIITLTIHYSLFTFSVTLNFALLDLGFCFISFSVGTIGFFVITFSSLTVSSLINGFSSGSSNVPRRKKFFTNLSSME